MALNRLNISTIQRTISTGGSFNANILNDTFIEITNDFAKLLEQWNGQLVPLMSTLPDGELDSAVNAFLNGIDGKTIWMDVGADTSSSLLRYYHLSKQRPKTIKEVIEDIYGVLDGLDIQIDQAQTITTLSDGLTDEQKARIGINIFDTSQTSSSTSLDGLTEIHRLNIIQLAKDMYGSSLSPTWQLTNNGSPLLTNSVATVVNALLSIHGGSWNTDLTLDHSSLVEFIAIRTYVGMPSAIDTTPDYSSSVIIADGDDLTTAIGKLDAAALKTVDNYTALRAFESTSNHRKVFVLGRDTTGDGGEGLFIWQSASVAEDNDGTLIKVDTVTTGRWARIADGPYNPKWFGLTVTANNYNTQATYWDNGVDTRFIGTFISSGATYNNAMVIEIPADYERIVRADVKVLAAANNSEFSSHHMTMTFNVFGDATPVLMHDDMYAPTASGWYPWMEYTQPDLNIIVSGKSGENIEWRFIVDLFGMNRGISE